MKNQKFIEIDPTKFDITKNKKTGEIEVKIEPLSSKLFINPENITRIAINARRIFFDDAHYLTAYNLAFVESFAPDILTPDFLELVGEFKKLFENDSTSRLTAIEIKTGGLPEYEIAYKEEISTAGAIKK